MKISMKPETQQFKLGFDPSGEATITIRQARTGDVIKLGDLFSNQTRTWDEDAKDMVKLTQKWNPDELKRERAFLTVVGLDLEDNSGKPIFKFKEDKAFGASLDMSRSAFIKVWNILPSELTEEIHTWILQVNPQWGEGGESD